MTILADSIARNREIAGLHYPKDSEGGARLADLLDSMILTTAAVPLFVARLPLPQANGMSSREGQSPTVELDILTKIVGEFDHERSPPHGVSSVARRRQKN